AALVRLKLARRRPYTARCRPSSCTRYLRLEPSAVVEAMVGVFGALVAHYEGVSNPGRLESLLRRFGSPITALTLAHKAGRGNAETIYRPHRPPPPLVKGGGVGTPWPRGPENAPPPHLPAVPLPYPPPYRNIMDLLRKQLVWGWLRMRWQRREDDTPSRVDRMRGVDYPFPTSGPWRPEELGGNRFPAHRRGPKL